MISSRMRHLFLVVWSRVQVQASIASCAVLLAFLCTFLSLPMLISPQSVFLHFLIRSVVIGIGNPGCTLPSHLYHERFFSFRCGVCDLNAKRLMSTSGSNKSDGVGVLAGNVLFTFWCVHQVSRTTYFNLFRRIFWGSNELV